MDKNLQPNISDPIVIYNTVKNNRKAVSYTHLDVYKRQQPKNS